MKNTRIALVGHGNVGAAVVRLISEIDPKGQRFTFSGIATRKRGIIELGNSPASQVDHRINKHLSDSSKLRSEADPNEIVDWLRSSDYEVLVEATDCNYIDAEPAISYIKTAMKRGKDSVTANKAPIAIGLKELRSIGERTGARIRFESTVMDGTPLFSVFTEAIPPVRVRRIRGVLNSTTNIVLDFLQQRRTIKEGLAKAKSLGLTESDPHLDLNGIDSAAKLTILANALNNIDMKMSQVLTQALTEQTYLSAKKLSSSKGPNAIIRQVSVADFDKKFFRVSLEAVKQEDLLYSCSGSSNLVSFSFDIFTELIISSRNPMLRDTAFGIYSDLANLQNQRKST